jgi:acetyl esterase/lipase
MKGMIKLAGAFTAVGAAALATAQAPAPTPTFEPDGTVRVPAFDLPPSPFVSKEALALQKDFASKLAPTAAPPAPPSGLSGVALIRRGAEAVFAPRAEALMKRYPADVVEQRMGGVRTRVIIPRGVKVDPKRVLINVHGGGFYSCSEACGLMESLPIASLTGFKVITIDYRMAPEHVFPAASEDVAAVYRQLLKTYKPASIGMYGCSAGGSLSAQAAAWLPAHGLPQLGAIGVFGAGAVRFGAGDSTHLAGLIDGLWRTPRPASTASQTPAMPAIRSYFEGADMAAPMVSPALHPAVLRKFPATLLITGTRAMDLSPAVVTHSKLLEAGVASQLIVGEGMGHCYLYLSELPEAQSAYHQIAKFFRTNLR